MLFFRSEEGVREWYSTRLEPESRRPEPDEMRRIFARLGLTDEFWNPRSDAFGAGGGRGPSGQ